MPDIPLNLVDRDAGQMLVLHEGDGINLTPVGDDDVRVAAAGWDTRVFYQLITGNYMYLANGAVELSYFPAARTIDKDAGAWGSSYLTVPAQYQSGYLVRVSGTLRCGPNPWTNWAQDTTLVTWMGAGGFSVYSGNYTTTKAQLNFQYPGLFVTGLPFAFVVDPAIHGYALHQVVTWYSASAFGGTPYEVANATIEVMPKP